MDKEVQIRDILTRFGEFIKGNMPELDFDGALKALLSIIPPPKKDRPPWGIVVNDLEDALLRAKIEDILTRYSDFVDGNVMYDVKDVLDIDEAFEAILLAIQPPKDKPPLLSDEKIKAYVDKYRNDDKPFIFSIRLLQAQREADIKHYEN